MPGDARLVKVKARAKRWKNLYKHCQKDNDALYAQYKERADEIERLNGILENMLPTGTVGGRIKQLETTNEFLEGRSKYQEARIKELEQAYQGAYAEVKRLKRLIVDKDRRISSLEPAFTAAASDADKYADRVNELESALSAEVAKAIELHQAHATKVQKIKSLEDWLKSRDHTVYQLNERIKELKDLEAQMADLQRRLDMQREANDRLRDRIGRLEKELADKDAVVKLQSKLLTEG